MASSFLPSIVLVFLCIAPSYARLSTNITGEMLNEICSKTQNPPFCLQVLKSNPGVANTDLQGLAQITIGLAHTNATNTFNFIQTLVNKTTNPQLKERYRSCSENYDDAIDDLEQAQQNLGLHDYGGVRAAASGALDQADDCKEDFKQPPADPSPLPQRNQNLENLCDIILVVSDILLRSN